MSDEAIVIHDGHVILECNEAFCTLFRCACDDLTGLRIEEIIFDEDLKKLAVWRGKHIMADPADKKFEQQYSFHRCDDSTFWGTSISKRIDATRYETRIKWSYDDPD